MSTQLLDSSIVILTPAQDVPERPMALVKTVRDDNQTTQTTVGALGDRVEDYTTRLPRGGLAEPPRVIQHPGGRPKAVAIQRCRTDRVGIPGIEDGGLDQDFEHTCDTEGGSSGSPVLDRSGRVIGLHHFGFTEEAAVRRNQAVLMQRVVASFPNDLKAGLVP